MIIRKNMASFLLAGIALTAAISPALARDNGANAFAMQMYQQTLMNQQAQAAAAQQQVFAQQMQQKAAQDAWSASMGLVPNGAGGYMYPDGAPYVPGYGRPEAALRAQYAQRYAQPYGQYFAPQNSFRHWSHWNRYRD
jgi:hypothetical protein